MATQASIINLSLAKLGAQQITTIHDATKSAKVASQFWDTSLRATLADLDWHFARKRVELALVEDKPVCEYAYAFQLPGDFVKLRKIFDYDGLYTIEGRYLLANTDKIKIVYTGYMDDATLFPDHFVRCLVERLGFDMALILTTLTPEMSQVMYKQYEVAIMNAMDVEGISESQTIRRVDDWIVCRRRYYARQLSERG